MEHKKQTHNLQDQPLDPTKPRRVDQVLVTFDCAQTRESLEQLKCPTCQATKGKHCTADERSMIELARALMGEATDGKMCHYDSSVTRGGFIVDEHFPYVDRHEEIKEVVSYFRSRRSKRLRTKLPDDKRSNPLIAIPGSSGSGKSAFLVHLPDAEVFRACLSDPIVAPLTFNQRMTTATDSFAIRILYGALQGMVGIQEPFEEVLNTLDGDKKEFNARHVVELLWTLFGYRPIVVLVDELSKSNNPLPIAKEIGALLDTFEDVHVVISALNPGFVQNLASGSNRTVEYVVPEPLLNQSLGAETCHTHAQKFAQRPLLTTILQNAHLLASGHPLTLANLDLELAELQEGTPRHDELKTLMEAPRGEAFSLIMFLARTVGEFSNVADPTTNEFEMILQSNPTPYLNPDKGLMFRVALENNRIFVGRRGKHLHEALAATTFAKFWKCLHEIDKPLTLTAVAQTLFSVDRQGFETSLGSLVERAVDMTLISRSHAGQSINEVFGVTGISSQVAMPLKLAVRLLSDNAQLREGTWETPPEGAPGMDACGRIFTKGNLTFDVYTQVKCSKPGKDEVTIMASAIAKIIKRHQDSQIHSIPFIIFYENYKHDRPTQDAVLKEMRTNKSIHASSLAKSFVETLWNNVKIVDQQMMASWLLPTLVPVLRLVHAIELPPEDIPNFQKELEDVSIGAGKCSNCSKSAPQGKNLCLTCFWIASLKNPARNSKNSPEEETK